jgi:hypothetical protein
VVTAQSFGTNVAVETPKSSFVSETESPSKPDIKAHSDGDVPSPSPGAAAGKSNSDGSKVPGKSKSQGKRPQCKYGAQCYRKNLAHKNEFSHPGDADYPHV